MKQKLNFTSRKRILREHVDIAVKAQPGGVPTVHCRLNLASYDFPHDAVVYLEATRRGALMRLGGGQVEASALVAGPLDQIDSGPALKFRVKVVDETSAVGLLLGVADDLRPTEAESGMGERGSLLGVASADLAEVPWRLNFETVETRGVLLEVNARFEDRFAFINSPAFRELVLPAIVKEVLLRIFEGMEEFPGRAVAPDWAQAWFGFLCDAMPSSPGDPPRGGGRTALLDWVDDAVGAFAKWQRCVTKALARGES